MPDLIKLPQTSSADMRKMLPALISKKIRQLNIEGRENLQKEVPKGKKTPGKSSNALGNDQTSQDGLTGSDKEWKTPQTPGDLQTNRGYLIQIDFEQRKPVDSRN